MLRQFLTFPVLGPKQRLAQRATLCPMTWKGSLFLLFIPANTSLECCRDEKKKESFSYFLFLHDMARLHFFLAGHVDEEKINKKRKSGTSLRVPDQGLTTNCRRRRDLYCLTLRVYADPLTQRIGHDSIIRLVVPTNSCEGGTAR